MGAYNLALYSVFKINDGTDPDAQENYASAVLDTITNTSMQNYPDTPKSEIDAYIDRASDLLAEREDEYAEQFIIEAEN